MEMTVYRQASKERPDGTIVYKGEDGKPYVDEQMIMVADGMGGAAAIRHQTFNKDIFDEEKIMDVLFKDVFEHYDDERFKKYVLDSFYELFSVKNIYFDKPDNMKKSGYFASRIVTAIMVHEVIYNENIENACCDLLEPDAGSEEFKNNLEKIGARFTELVRDGLIRIADNANLVYESSYAGLALLGCTLCSIIYREKEDCVEALYLTAGDSRPYVWTEEDGLCQVLADEEGADGGMTNYIKANKDETFVIHSNFKKFKKPCILFGATDGIFDSGYFVHQMSFEKLLLETIMNSWDEKEMSTSLTEFFKDYGRHDDSSTIAMKMFGFADFDELKRAASKRLSYIEDHYLSKMSDLLEKDYISEYEASGGALIASMKAMKEQFAPLSCVTDYSISRLYAGDFPEYDAAMAKLAAKKQEIQAEMDGCKEEMKKVVAPEFLLFTDALGISPTGFMNKFNLDKISKLHEEQLSLQTEFMQRLERRQFELERNIELVRELFRQIYDLGMPVDFSTYSEVNFDCVGDCGRSMTELIDLLEGLRDKKDKSVKNLIQVGKDYGDMNAQLAEKYPDKLEIIATAILGGTLKVDTLKLRMETREGIQGIFDKIDSCKKRIEEVDGEESRSVFRKALSDYWEKNYVKVIAAVVSDPAANIDSELRTEAQRILAEAEASSGELKTLAEAQSALFDEYDAIYNKYINEVNA